MDFKKLMASGSSAQLAEGESELEEKGREAEARKVQLEARRKACLVDDDHQGVDQCERQLKQLGRDLDAIAEKRQHLARRREEVERQDAAAKLDALVKRGEAVQAAGLKRYARYEELCTELRDAVLPGIAEVEREIREINSALREAGDPRQVQSPVGVLFDQRGGDAGFNRLELTMNTRLPAVIGQRHFWPRPK